MEMDDLKNTKHTAILSRKKDFDFDEPSLGGYL